LRAIIRPNDHGFGPHRATDHTGSKDTRTGGSIKTPRGCNVARARVSRAAGAVTIILVAENIGVMAAGRIWVENKVDYSNPRNLITVAVAFTAGAGNLTLKFGGFEIGGIGTATTMTFSPWGLPAQREAKRV
jgi:hypothetical protein